MNSESSVYSLQLNTRIYNWGNVLVLVVELVMVGGREFSKIGPRNENYLAPYDTKRARGIEREVVLVDLKDRAGLQKRDNRDTRVRVEERDDSGRQ